MTRDRMLFRFSLYGFLKNQRYFDPFIILAFREAGMSFLQIGILIGFRELCINLFEVPSGALADLWGRRRSMILSFTAYILAFLVFAFAGAYWEFFPAMLLFSIGAAFRTGTHKAMIMAWLKLNDRLDDTTHFYGYTRSWSKLGSALSVLIASLLVFTSNEYRLIFLFSIPPYILGIVNFLGYPAFVDEGKSEVISISKTARHLMKALKQSIRKTSLRGLLLESMTFEAAFQTSKDYLQPIIKQYIIGSVFLIMLIEEQRIAILVGVVYFILYLISAGASRQTHRLVRRCGTEHNACGLTWAAVLFLFLTLTATLAMDEMRWAILAFIFLFAVQNIFRPAIISRFKSHAEIGSMATMLSIESQSRTAATMVLAPLMGWAVDQWGFGCIGLVGLMVCTMGTISWARSSSQ